MFLFCYITKPKEKTATATINGKSEKFCYITKLREKAADQKINRK